MWSVYWPQRNVRDTGKSFFLSFFFLSFFLSFFLVTVVSASYLLFSNSLSLFVAPPPPLPMKSRPSINGRVSRNSSLSSAISASLEETTMVVYRIGSVPETDSSACVLISDIPKGLSKALAAEPRTYLRRVSTADLQQNIWNDLCILTC